MIYFQEGRERYKLATMFSNDLRSLIDSSKSFNSLQFDIEINTKWFTITLKWDKTNPIPYYARVKRVHSKKIQPTDTHASDETVFTRS